MANAFAEFVCRFQVIRELSDLLTVSDAVLPALALPFDREFKIGDFSYDDWIFHDFGFLGWVEMGWILRFSCAGDPF